MAAFAESLARVNQNDLATKSALKNLYELAGEGDFGNEKDGRFTFGEGARSELEVDVGLAATGDATQETGGLSDGFESGKGGFLSGVEGDRRMRKRIWGI